MKKIMNIYAVRIRRGSHHVFLDMSSPNERKQEVDRLARLFTKALFNLHSDSTAPTTPARISSIITEEPLSRSVPLALAKATVGFATTFDDLLRVLIRTIKSVFAYERIKQLQIEDPELGLQGFVELAEHDFREELKDAYQANTTTFKLKDEDGTLNTLHPCINAAFFSAVAITQGLGSSSDYHRTVVLTALKLGGGEEGVEPDVREAYTIASLVAFAVVSPQKYAQIVARDDVTADAVLESLKGLRGNGEVLHANALNLLEVRSFTAISTSPHLTECLYVFSLLFATLSLRAPEEDLKAKCEGSCSRGQSGCKTALGQSCPAANTGCL